MKLSRALSVLVDLRFAIGIAFWPTLKSIFKNPFLLFHPHQLSRLFFSHLWAVFGDGVDANSKAVKDGLITPYAYGTVLDIGAGSGHTVHYLNRARVSRYVALEPNHHLHPKIRKTANNAGFHESDDSLLILSCGGEDTDSILRALKEFIHSPRSPRSPTRMGARHTSPPNLMDHQVDTIISILTFCTIPAQPHPRDTIRDLTRHVLKPGGQLLYYEHVLNPRPDVVWWQRFWTPIWAFFFDGCRMDRPTDVWIREISEEGSEGSTVGVGRPEQGALGSIWREGKVWKKDGEEEDSMFWHSIGRYVKK